MIGKVLEPIWQWKKFTVSVCIYAVCSTACADMFYPTCTPRLYRLANRKLKTLEDVFVRCEWHHRYALKHVTTNSSVFSKALLLLNVSIISITRQFLQALSHVCFTPLYICTPGKITICKFIGCHCGHLCGLTGLHPPSTPCIVASKSTLDSQV